MSIAKLALVTAVILIASRSFAQESPRVPETRGELGRVGFQAVELPGAPAWLAEFEFDSPSFTFIRLQYSAAKSGFHRGAWMTDYPDADLALAAQVGGMTKLDVSHPSKALKIVDPQLVQYPFAYIAEAGSMLLSEADVVALRKYVDKGGFVMIDDFWGQEEFLNVKRELKKVFPDRELQKLSMDHAIFHCVFNFDEPPQSVSVHSFMSGSDIETRHPAAFYGIEQEHGKLSVLICHNNDLADGWERAEDSRKFAEEISKPFAFPMGINAVFYALTRDNQ